MMQRKIIIISLILLGIFTAGDISSQPMGRMKRGQDPDQTPPPPQGFAHLKGIYFGDQDNMHHMQEMLDLTEKQIEDISKINKEFGDMLFKYNNKLKPLNERLRDLLLSSKINLEEVRSTLKEISNIEIEIRMTRIKHRIAIENIFSSAQRKMLNNEKKWMRRRDD